MSSRSQVIALAIWAAGVSLPCAAQFSVKTADGNVATVGDGRFVRTEAAASGFSFGGIDVADIAEIRSAAYVPNPDAGLPEGAVRLKPAAILDLTAAVGENESAVRNRYSCEYMLNVAGIPYFVTTSLEEAVGGSSLMVLTSTPKSSTFSAEDIARLKGYVSDGALLFAPNIGNVATDGLKELFGVASVAYSTKQSGRTLVWSSERHSELCYIDEPEEQTTAIGSINVACLTPSTGTAMGYYNGDAAAVGVVKNTLGNGAAYLFGCQWGDVVQRPQLNKDTNTNRGKSNTFEPSADMYPLFIRAAYAAANPVATWKYTVPDGYHAVLVPTHDCDSRTAMDEMHYMADYEQSLGLRAHYFLTVHYFRQQGYMSAFWNDETFPAMKNLLRAGHTVGSHSICHYPDFGSYTGAALDAHFPMKEYTREEYAAYATHDMSTGVSYGSTWAELVLSKQIMEKDLGVRVRAFRSGHLCVNAHMPEAHKQAAYDFSSCYTASSVQSQFPFIQRMNNEWDGEPTGTLQLPLHFSDVFSSEAMNEDNYQEKARLWIELFNKLKGNYASSIILVHPNREWKMTAQKILVEGMDKEVCGLYNFIDYGDFWLGRERFDYESFVVPDDNKVIVRAKATDIAANPSLAITIEVQGADAPSVVLIDEDGVEHPSTLCHLDGNRHLLILSKKN